MQIYAERGETMHPATFLLWAAVVLAQSISSACESYQADLKEVIKTKEEVVIRRTIKQEIRCPAGTELPSESEEQEEAKNPKLPSH